MIKQKFAIRIDNLQAYYGSHHALKNISLAIERNKVTAFIGPSGCGKSTFLRALNRMNDSISGARIEGDIWIDGQNANSARADVVELRKNAGMVFQQANIFPFSIYENVAYGPRINGMKNKKELNEVIETSLKSAALWDEVKDSLHRPAGKLSGGQKQRLAIARVLAVKPEILLMDEPTSALDPVSTAKLEELIIGLKERYTIVIITHNMQQAARISDRTAFFLDGEVKEYDTTGVIFGQPKYKETADYIAGRFG